MAASVYLLCAVTSLICMGLLIQNWWRSRSRLLLWSALCFVGLGINNTLLFVDLVVFPTQIDLAIPRVLSALAGVIVLLIGFIWEADR
jgi:hypothetical protein